MTTTLKIQITLVILIFSLFGIIFTKTIDAAAPVSYEKAGRFYLSERAGKCNNGYLEDKYDAVVEYCGGGTICTTVPNSNGKNEVGCFIQKAVEVEQPPPVVVRTPVVAAPSSCPLTKEEYPQCGGTEGLEDKPKNHTFNIVRYVDCKGSVVKYDPPEDLGDHGQCIKYKVATSELALQKAPSYSYTTGGVIVSAPSDIYSIDSTPGRKAIFVQFLDANEKIIKFNNGSDFAVEYIDLVSPQPPEAIAAKIETSLSVSGTNRTWEPTSVKVTLSGFKETGATLAAVFIRQQTGVCTVENCSFLGWTKIKTYGTNGTDEFLWTPKPGDLSEGVHMFGLFSLNSDGTANKLLSVSPTNYLPK